MHAKFHQIAFTTLATFTLGGSGIMALATPANAAPPPKLYQNATYNAKKWAPRFDYDGDGCYPSVMIGINGKVNGGLKPTGAIDGECGDKSDLDNSNTYHRSMCRRIKRHGNRYCGHMYALYFEKDQTLRHNLFDIGRSSGHRHDVEYVVIWLKNGQLTHVSHSEHSDTKTRDKSQVPFADRNKRHVKIVYHKDGALTHAFRFAKRNEKAENPKGGWHLPTLVSWSRMNKNLQDKFNKLNLGKATVVFNNSNFRRQLNNAKPEEYPSF